MSTATPRDIADAMAAALALPFIETTRHGNIARYWPSRLEPAMYDVEIPQGEDWALSLLRVMREFPTTGSCPASLTELGRDATGVGSLPGQLFGMLKVLDQVIRFGAHHIDLDTYERSLHAQREADRAAIARALADERKRILERSAKARAAKARKRAERAASTGMATA